MAAAKNPRRNELISALPRSTVVIDNVACTSVATTFACFSVLGSAPVQGSCTRLETGNGATR